MTSGNSDDHRPIDGADLHQPPPSTEAGPDAATGADPDATADANADGVLVVSGDGQATDDGQHAITDLVEQPAKVMRIGSMIKQLLEEVRSAPLDDASRAQLKEIHARSIIELEDGLAPELVEELGRLTLPFTEDATPSDAELRIAQAQLVGWLEGLFHGIQAAMFAQQMAAQAQFEEMRRRAALGGAEAEHAAQVPPGGQRGPSGPYL